MNITVKKTGIEYLYIYQVKKKKEKRKKKKGDIYVSLFQKIISKFYRIIW